jgi:CRISPR/Cas system-associated protein Cas7 (RAMP superfamily)
MKFRDYLTEDYFEVTVLHGGTTSSNTETHIFPDAKNKKQAEKQAHYQFKKDYGNGKYEIISIVREKGNPGVTDKSPSEYGREREEEKRRRR